MSQPLQSFDQIAGVMEVVRTADEVVQVFHQEDELGVGTTLLSAIQVSGERRPETAGGPPQELAEAHVSGGIQQPAQRRGGDGTQLVLDRRRLLPVDRRQRAQGPDHWPPCEPLHPQLRGGVQRRHHLVDAAGRQQPRAEVHLPQPCPPYFVTRTHGTRANAVQTAQS
jgi:hypothetical protein